MNNKDDNYNIDIGLGKISWIPLKINHYKEIIDLFNFKNPLKHNKIILKSHT